MDVYKKINQLVCYNANVLQHGIKSVRQEGLLKFKTKLDAVTSHCAWQDLKINGFHGHLPEKICHERAEQTVCPLQASRSQRGRRVQTIQSFCTSFLLL